VIRDMHEGSGRERPDYTKMSPSRLARGSAVAIQERQLTTRPETSTQTFRLCQEKVQMYIFCTKGF
jgi:hypothetical protein